MTRSYTQRSSLTTADLQQRMLRIYDHLYANASVRTGSAIAIEIGKILHVASYIENQRPGLLAEEQFQLPAFKFDSNTLKQIGRGEIGACGEVAKRVQLQFCRMNEAWHLYEATTHINLKDTDLAYTCGELSGLIVSDKNRDVFGDALEVFRGQWAKRAGGQFFTDQHVTSLAMTLLDFDPRRGDDLVDLCAGTGGFLLAGLNHIHELLEQSGEVVESEFAALASSSLKGQEVDPEVREVANSTLTSRLGIVDHQIVALGDSLKIDTFSSKNPAQIRYANHRCVATNPPFGTKITIKDEGLLKHYELALLGARDTTTVAQSKISRRAPDILFLEQNIKLLQPGHGRLAIVVPYQILSGPQTCFVRQWLLRQAEILAVIDLPADTFQPHTGTKGSLLVVKRRSVPLENLDQVQDNPIFMSMPRWIGHDRRGNPVYRRNADGTSTGEILSDFTAVKEAFNAFLEGGDVVAAHPESFQVDYREICKDHLLRLNASFHKPNHSITHHTSPQLVPSETSDWEYVFLRDVVKKIFYPGRFKRNYTDFYSDAVPFLGGSNISQLLIVTDKWLRHDDPHLEELKVRAGWVLITRSGSTGIVSSVPQAWDGYAISEHVIRIVPDEEKINPAYLYAFLKTEFAQILLSKGVFGSVIDEINPDFIGAIKVPVPRSSAILDNINETITKAQTARDLAIGLLNEAVADLNYRLMLQ